MLSPVDKAILSQKLPSTSVFNRSYLVTDFFYLLRLWIGNDIPSFNFKVILVIGMVGSVDIKCVLE